MKYDQMFLDAKPSVLPIIILEPYICQDSGVGNDMLLCVNKLLKCLEKHLKTL